MKRLPNSLSYELYDRGKVNSWVYYNDSLFKELTPALECEENSQKKVSLGN
jgi:hypothetical protein